MVSPADNGRQPAVQPPGFIDKVLSTLGLAAAPKPGVPAPVATRANGKRPLRALVLSGWGVKPEALDAVIPPEVTDVIHFQYHDLHDKAEVLRALQAQNTKPDIVIGWSLGGKLAVRAVAEEVVKPKLLVLVGTSYEFIADGGINNAVKHLGEGNFYDNFRARPDETREVFLQSMLKGDTRTDKARAAALVDPAHDLDWLHWLTALKFGCEDLDLSRMPRTLIVHGAQDGIVLPDQAAKLHEHIRNSRLEMIPEAGHMPHLHAPERVKQLIHEEIRGLGLGQPAQVTVPGR